MQILFVSIQLYLLWHLNPMSCSWLLVIIFFVLFCKLILSLKKFLSECMSKFEDDQFTNTRELHSTSRCTVKYWFNLWFWYWVFFFSLNVYITNNYFKDTVVLPKLTGATNEQLVAAQWGFCAIYLFENCLVSWEKLHYYSHKSSVWEWLLHLYR